MGFFEKIKNALFEEEYVEVEEKPKRVKKEVQKKEERPIAKKVVLPKKEEARVEELDEDEYLDEDFEIQPEVEKIPMEQKRDFKVMEEDDFKVEEEYVRTEPKIVKVIDNEEPSVRNEAHYYQSKKDKLPYGIDDSSRVNVYEYGRGSERSQYSGAYERKEDRTHFRPSPIISPIYGILDKNYKKEDVVTKREVRLTSSYARENLSVDDVRKKAYGSLSDDIARELYEPKKDTTFEVSEKEDDGNLLVDLSDEKEKPAVKEVTMGDALEYFEDLGLEYNVDYVDASKEKATGRRSKDNYELDLKESNTYVKEHIEDNSNKDDVLEFKKQDVDVDSDDNLFDLIDSMYKDND